MGLCSRRLVRQQHSGDGRQVLEGDRAEGARPMPPHELDRLIVDKEPRQLLCGEGRIPAALVTLRNQQVEPQADQYENLWLISQTLVACHL